MTNVSTHGPSRNDQKNREQKFYALWRNFRKKQQLLHQLKSKMEEKSHYRAESERHWVVISREFAFLVILFFFFFFLLFEVEPSWTDANRLELKVWNFRVWNNYRVHPGLLFSAKVWMNGALTLRWCLPAWLSEIGSERLMGRSFGVGFLVSPSALWWCLWCQKGIKPMFYLPHGFYLKK